MKPLEVDEKEGKSDSAPKLGFQLWSCKGGFNSKAEPAMAVYELQYKYRRTTLFVELSDYL